MRSYLVIAIVILIPSCFADQHIEINPRHIHRTYQVNTLDAVFSQTYDFYLILNGFSNCGAHNRWVCDDFVLQETSYVNEIRIWMIWPGGQQGTVMNLAISRDDAGDSDPNNCTEIWVESVPCTNTATGDIIWGCDVYETFCTIDVESYPVLDIGEHYYFETQVDQVDDCFILVSYNFYGDYCWWDNGYGVYERSDFNYGHDSDLFFDFYGGPASDLVSDTWGSIKTLF